MLLWILQIYVLRTFIRTTVNGLDYIRIFYKFMGNLRSSERIKNIIINAIIKITYAINAFTYYIISVVLCSDVCSALIALNTFREHSVKFFFHPKSPLYYWHQIRYIRKGWPYKNYIIFYSILNLESLL